MGSLITINYNNEVRHNNREIKERRKLKLMKE